MPRCWRLVCADPAAQASQHCAKIGSTAKLRRCRHSSSVILQPANNTVQTPEQHPHSDTDCPYPRLLHADFSAHTGMPRARSGGRRAGPAQASGGGAAAAAVANAVVIATAGANAAAAAASGAADPFLQQLLDPAAPAERGGGAATPDALRQHFLENPAALSAQAVHAIAISKSKAAAASQAAVRDVLVHSGFPARASLRIMEHLLQLGPSHSSSAAAAKPSAAISARVDAFVVLVVCAPGAEALAAGTLHLLHHAARTQQLGQPRWALLMCDVLGACSCYGGRDRVAACLQLFDAMDAATLSCKALKVVAALAASPDIDAAGRTDLLDSLTQQLERTGIMPTAALPPAAAALRGDGPVAPLAVRPAATTSKQVTSSVLRAVVSILHLESPGDVIDAAHRHARRQLVHDRIVPHVLRLVEGHLARNTSAAVVSLLTSAWTAGMSAFSLVEYIRASSLKPHNAHVQTLSAKVADVVYGLFADDVGNFLQKTQLFVAEVLQRAANPDAALAIIHVFTDQCVSDLITPAELDELLANSMAEQPRSLDTTVCMLLLLVLKTHGAAEHGLHDAVSRWALQGLRARNGDAPVAASYEAQIRESRFAAVRRLRSPSCIIVSASHATRCISRAARHAFACRRRVLHAWQCCRRGCPAQHHQLNARR